jgi:hypothetical protein
MCGIGKNGAFKKSFQENILPKIKAKQNADSGMNSGDAGLSDAQLAQSWKDGGKKGGMVGLMGLLAQNAKRRRNQSALSQPLASPPPPSVLTPAPPKQTLGE